MAEGESHGPVAVSDDYPAGAASGAAADRVAGQLPARGPGRALLSGVPLPLVPL